MCIFKIILPSQLLRIQTERFVQDRPASLLCSLKVKECIFNLYLFHQIFKAFLSLLVSNLLVLFSHQS